MDRGLKERLVGAAVLIALGVWLIPLVLDGPDPDVAEDATGLALPAVSEPAPVSTRTIPLDAPDASVADAVREPDATTDTPAPAASAQSPGDAATGADAASAPQPAAEPPASSAEPDSAPAAESASEPEPLVAQSPQQPGSSPATEVALAPAASGDWLVQLGSFGEQDNARRLAERISGYGHSPEISTHRAGGRTLHRVRIGPYETRERAEAMVSSLAAHGFVGGQVVVADGN